MKYWDSSAILPLLLEEAQSLAMQGILKEDGAQTVWCLTEVEILSALARRDREGLDATDAEEARTDFRYLAERWVEIDSLDLVRSRAVRLLNTHAFRAADALQLGAALIASAEHPESLPFVCLDDRLRDAARREGFPVLPS